MRNSNIIPGTIAGFGLVGLVAAFALAIGWVINIITIVNHINDPVTGMQVLRAVGIFVAPLGGILGYI